MSGKDRSGILKKADQTYLGLSRDGFGGADSKWYNGKARLRASIRQGIVDFTDIQQNLDNWNWQKFTNGERREEQDLREGMVAATALFYEFHESKGWDFGTTLRDAIDHAYTHGTTTRDMPQRVFEGVNFEAKTREPEQYRELQRRARKKMEQGLSLTTHEKATAVDVGGEFLQEVREYQDGADKRRRESEALENINEMVERHGSPDVE